MMHAKHASSKYRKCFSFTLLLLFFFLNKALITNMPVVNISKIRRLDFFVFFKLNRMAYSRVCYISRRHDSTITVEQIAKYFKGTARG